MIAGRARRGFSRTRLVLSRPDAEPSGVSHDVGGSPAGPATRPCPPPRARSSRMRENANDGWTAAQGGRPLTPVVVDGWQQGWWLLDPGAARRRPRGVRFTPGSASRRGPAGGLLALVVLVGGMLLRRPRRDHPPTGRPAHPGEPCARRRRRRSRPARGVARRRRRTVVAPAPWWLTRRAPDAVPFVAGALCLVAAIDYAVTPWGSSSGWAGNDPWPHYLVLVVLSGAVASLLDVESGRTPASATGAAGTSGSGRDARPPDRRPRRAPR